MPAESDVTPSSCPRAVARAAVIGGVATIVLPLLVFHDRGAGSSGAQVLVSFAAVGAGVGAVTQLLFPPCGRIGR
jgi:uncharacterized membrane protein YgaE (UPF0421/DUF939 family)